MENGKITQEVDLQAQIIGLSDNVTYVIEDITSKDVSNYRYTLNFNPKMWILTDTDYID